ncbi:MAG: DUF434 domain-containing protein [Planctomycetales bacterium]|nr:DUF434 domain-containing protein [Planctomycetales bacterium]
MPDHRKHRGPHPEDAELFGTSALPALRQAASEYCYLLDRGYPPVATLKLVGDRHRLRERQRIALNRSTCSAAAAASRRAREVALTDCRHLVIDGFNVVTTIEAALAGGVVIVGREGCYRDMASMHGSYRRVQETAPALESIGEQLQEAGVTQAEWLLDEPVSNSGRLAGVMRELAKSRGWPWSVRLVPDPDRELSARRDAAIASADREVLDAGDRWCNLAAAVVRATLRDAWVVAFNT